MLLKMTGHSLAAGVVLGLLLFLPLLAARIRGEEAMLREGLPGYRDYATRVRFRLLPGLW